MNIKKILIVIGFVAFVSAIAFAIYWVFFKPLSNTGPGGTPDFVPGNIPGIASGTPNVVDNGNDTILPWQDYFDNDVSPVANGGLTEVKRVTSNSVSGITSGTYGLQYYDKNDQKFYRLNEEGKPIVLSDEKFYGVEQVTWEKTGEKAILEYPDGSNILYNFKTGKQVTLPRELEEFSFNGSANQIVAEWVGDSEENNWLITANDDGSRMRLIEPIGDQSHNVQVAVSPDNQVAALFREYIDDQRQEVFPLGFNKENLKSFVVAGAGFESKWSDDGQNLIYNVYNKESNYNPTLWVTSGSTGNLGDIKVSLNLQTWAEKCTFSNTGSIICAVPQGLPRGSGLVPEIASDYRDNFYSVDLSTGAKTLLASPVGEGGLYSASDLFVSNDGSILYFTDTNSGILQSIRLR